MNTIEKDFEHNGYRCIVLNHRHRCGYVAIPESHALYGVDYSENIFPKSMVVDEPIGDRGIIPMFCAGKDMISLDVLIDVHGSITFSKGSHYGIPERNLEFLRTKAQHETLGKLYARELGHTLTHKGEPTLYPVPSETPVWWFGFDCGHCYDTHETCDVEYVTQQCIKLADQLEKHK